MTRHILVLFSLSYIEVSQTRIFNIVNSPSFKSFGHGRIKPTDFREHLQKLTNLSFLLYTEGKPYRCNPEIVELVTRESLKDGSFLHLAQIIENDVEENRYYNWDFLFPFARIALYRGDKNLFDSGVRLLEGSGSNYYRYTEASFNVFKVLACLNHPFQAEFMRSYQFQENHLEEFFLNILVDSIVRSIPNLEGIDFLLELTKAKDERITPTLLNLVMQHLLYQGKVQEFQEFEKLYPDREESSLHLLAGIKDFIEGKNETSISHFKKTTEILKKKENKRNYEIDDFESILYFFALLKEGESDNYQKAFDYSERVSKNKNHKLQILFKTLNTACIFLSRRETDTNKLSFGFVGSKESSFWILFPYTLAIYWVVPKRADQLLTLLKNCLKNVQEAGYL